MKYTIAAFDFDGTIINRDSMWGFMKKTHHPFSIIINLILAFPFLLLYKLKLLSNGKAKQLLFSRFYRNWPVDKFNTICMSFQSFVKQSIRPEVYQYLRDHLNAGHKVIIVSASAENWIIPWAKEEGVDAVLATQLEVNTEGKLTGQFSSPNCYGKEKVKRILEKYPERDCYKLIAYGDSKGDFEMLQMADESHYLNRK